MSRRGWMLFLALCVIWGIPYLLIKVAVADINPLLVAFCRVLIGGLILLPIALKQRALGPVLKRWPLLLLYTVIEICIPWFFLGLAETKLNSSTAGLLIAVVPLIASVILWATGQDKFSRIRVIGLILGFAGVAALVGLDIRLDNLLAVGAVAITAIGYAVGPIIISRKFTDLPASGVITASLLLAAVIYAPFVTFVWPTQAVSAQSLWAVIALGVLCTATAFTLFFALIGEAGPARASVITYVNPAVAIILGVLLLSEPFTIGTAIGFPLVILGSVLATSRNRTRGKKTAAINPEATTAVASSTPSQHP
ncbi:EamA family transporter [Nakamurella antarctica]|uniref:EamA family transporter n=1 Tax=Nakamurella antarctica TaxID=1902245 RepID=A0A3G8ZP97_9ACTN|nr:DMT family transporter [Nakamurella antarctica]AZI59090.1 EamA family transporter [Nakamurella antarctica]